MQIRSHCSKEASETILENNKERSTATCIIVCLAVCLRARYQRDKVLPLEEKFLEEKFLLRRNVI